MSISAVRTPWVGALVGFAMVIAIVAVLIPTLASADHQIIDVSIEPAEVAPGGIVTVSVTVETDGQGPSDKNEWSSTAFSFTGASGLNQNCSQAPLTAVSGSGTTTAEFQAQAPDAEGEFELWLKIWGGEDCGGSQGSGNVRTGVSVVVEDDVDAPTVTIDQAAGQADPTNSGPVNFTVVFSEAVSGFASEDVALTGTAGATAAVVTGGPATYNVAVSGMTTDGTVIADVETAAAIDGASNASAASTSTDNSVTLDTGVPSVTIDQAVGQADPTNSGPVNFTVVFSEAVSGFASEDVALTGTAGATAAVVTGGPATYNVAVSGMTTDGTVIADVVAAAAIDAGSNASTASTSTDNSVTLDATIPSVTIDQAAAQADPTDVSPINFIVVFGEDVTGFASEDVALTGTAGATAAVVTGGPATYNVAVSGMTSSGTVIANVLAAAAIDAAGNASSTSTSTDNVVTFDATADPTVSISDVSVVEGDAGFVGATFNVTLSHASTEGVTVVYQTGNVTAAAPGDYTAVGLTVVSFLAGETSKNVTVNVAGDLVIEANETFTVVLSNPTNATLADAIGVGTILDDDGTPSLSIGNASVVEGDSGSHAIVFAVTLSSASAETVSVNVATGNGSAVAGSDYVPTAGTLVFSPGVTTMTFSVLVVGDIVDESDEAFFVNLSGAVNATISDGQGRGAIVDDDGSLSRATTTMRRKMTKRTR